MKALRWAAPASFSPAARLRFAPGLFSMTTGWPHIGERREATARVMTSVAPPGAYATPIFTTFEGYFWASAATEPAASATARNAFMELILIRGQGANAPRSRPRFDLLLQCLFGHHVGKNHSERADADHHLEDPLHFLRARHVAISRPDRFGLLHGFPPERSQALYRAHLNGTFPA